MAKSDLEAPIQVVACLKEKESIRVLHVDDDALFLKVADECLKMDGSFEVDVALSVDEAFNKMKEKEYNAVVSDYEMPCKDGLEFLKQLRKKGNGIPFIIFTGRGREEVAIKALNYGADQYLNKTGDPETVYCELAHAIRKAVDRRSAQIELLKREAKLNAILESSPEAITITDLDGNIVECNQAATHAYGDQSKENLIGKNALEFIAKKDREKAIQNLKKTIGQGSVKTVEYTALTKDGREFLGELSASVVRDASGKPEYLVTITRDITERKKAEEKLWKSEKSWSDSFNSLEDVMITIGKDYTIEKMNDSGLKLLGKTGEEVTGKKCYQVIHGLDAPCEFCSFKRTLKTGKMESVGRYIKYLDKYFSIKSSPIFNERGEIVGFVDLMRDTTEQKKDEETLRESEEKYRELINGMNDAVWVIDFDGNFIDVNNAAVEVLGYSKEELLSMGPPDIDNSLTVEQIRDLAKRMSTDQIQVFETAHTTKDGKKIPVEISSSLVTYHGKQAILSIARNITDRKKAEAALRRLVTIVTDSNDAITVVDMDGKITAWNKGAEDTYGYRKDEALGMDVVKIVPEDKKQETLDVIGKIKTNETVGSFETKRLAKDGRVLDVWLTVTKLVDDEGNAVALATTERDITEKKRLEENLRFSEKFTVVGQLASSVAHEIRNPLGVINNSVYFLNVRLKEHADEKVVKHLKIMAENITAADRIISDLLDLSRNNVGVFELVDLNIILKRAFASLSVPENIKVITKVDKIPQMLIDPERMKRVFLNIIQNAVAAMPKGGKLVVGLSRFGDSVEISFKDSGVGIPEESMQKLFTPLFTTKAKGLGLGLAICKQIVEGHNGDIVVKSNAGEGALFIVRLPILSGRELVETGVLQADVLIGEMSK